MLKKRMIEEEKSELYTNCVQLKMKAIDGKMRETDTLDTQGIFRLIQSVPSPKAEVFKVWLSTLGKERVDEIFDPEIAISRAVDYYRNRGYSNEWIKARLDAVVNRKKLTEVWKELGINKDYEYAILTNEIYKNWSRMIGKEYKQYKGLRKENLRDNMSDVEVALTNLGEIATRELAKKHKPHGLSANKKVAKKGEEVAGAARTDLEEKLGETIITKDNALNYKYIDERKTITNQD